MIIGLMLWFLMLLNATRLQPFHLIQQMYVKVQTLILNGNPSGGTGTYTHEWSGPGVGSLLGTNIQSPTFSNLAAGSYDLTYKVTDSNGHSGTDDITVVVSGAAAPPVAICQDITVILDGTGSASIVPADINNGSYDLCSPVTLSLDITSFDCGDLETTQ